MSSQPLPELQLFFSFQVSFAFFLCFAFSHFLSFWMFLTCLPFLSHFYSYSLWPRCVSAVPSHSVFFPFSPLPHAALRDFGKPMSYQEWSFGLCWLWLCCHQCEEVPVETSGAKFFCRSAPVFVQLSWGWNSSGGRLVLFMKNILASFDKYGFKIWSILSAKTLSLSNEKPKRLPVLPMCHLLSGLAVNPGLRSWWWWLTCCFCWVSILRDSIRCSTQDQLLTVNHLLFRSFLGFSRSFSWRRNTQDSRRSCRTWFWRDRQKATLNFCANAFNKHYQSSRWLQP